MKKFALLVSCVLAVAGCGSSDDGTAGSGGTGGSGGTAGTGGTGGVGGEGGIGGEGGMGGMGPGSVSKDITLGCTNNLTADISILPWQLVADPGPIVAGNAVSIDFTGTAFFTESFLDAGLAAVPGLNKAALNPGNRGGATIVPRTGLSGGDAAGLEIEPAPIPTTCSGGMNAGGACVTDSDCPPVGYFDCLEIVELPTIDGTGDACAACNALGAPKDAQCANNGFCIAGPLPLPLEEVTGNYDSAVSNPDDVLLGWDDSNFVSIAGDGTYNLPAASFASAWQPAGLRVVVGILQIALNCNMAVDSGLAPPIGVGVPDGASPTPDSELLQLSIEAP